MTQFFILRRKRKTEEFKIKDRKQRVICPTLTGMDCVYLAVVFVNASVTTFIGYLRQSQNHYRE